ncbi:lipoprotein insertase outer membrane protein LolB [Parapusillimonas sp. JC17]|uniref:lipoprotein insertase outer membrane protein LolB n=1 Tax=Parapusillimonas sp. JC17 TaxID=3445768 RepID=UPI003FA056FA
MSKRFFLALFRTLLGAGLLALLGACATPQRIGGAADGDTFQRAGRFALTVNHAGGGQEAVQGGFAWHDTGRVLTLDLANPLGSTLARVTVEPGLATLVRSNGEREQATNPDELVEKVLGSPMPVSGLRQWLQGRGGQGGMGSAQKDGEGRLASFAQDGWQVQLSRYDALGPQLLQLRRNDAQRRISVRLVVDDGRAE